MSCHPERISFLGRPLPPGFARRVLALAPGRVHAYDESEWRDSLVVVERGELELECRAGGRRRFGLGSILWLVGLPLRLLRNRGPEPVVLVAISRLSAAASWPTGISVSDEFTGTPPSYVVSPETTPDHEEARPR